MSAAEFILRHRYGHPWNRFGAVPPTNEGIDFEKASIENTGQSSAEKAVVRAVLKAPAVQDLLRRGVELGEERLKELSLRDGFILGSTVIAAHVAGALLIAENPLLRSRVGTSFSLLNNKPIPVPWAPWLKIHASFDRHNPGAGVRVDLKFRRKERHGTRQNEEPSKFDGQEIEDAVAAELEAFGYIPPYQGSAVRQAQQTTAALSAGAPGPRNNPCTRLVALEKQIGRKSPSEIEELRLALQSPDAALMDECALMIDERLEAESLRAGISKAELKKTLRA